MFLFRDNAPLCLLLLLTLLSSKLFVKGCSQRPPCGTKVGQIKLTDVPYTLHIRVDQYTACDGTSQSELQSTAMVEIDMGDGEMRTEDEFKAQPIELGLSSLPTVDQNYDLTFTTGSAQVVVKRDGLGYVIYELTGFEYSGSPNTSPYEGVVVFYSGILLNIFYFIYSDVDRKEHLAVCTSDGTCDISDFDSGLPLVRNSERQAVYDDMQIVGLEVPCCLCISTSYYLFDEDGITAFDILNGYPDVVDPRIGVAYSVDDMGSDFIITSETVPFFKQSMTLKQRQVKKALRRNEGD